MTPKLAEIHTRIEREVFIATTPHVPGLQGVDVIEAKAVNDLLAAIRDHRRQYERRGEPVPWRDEVEPTGPDTQVRRLSGVRPSKTQPLIPTDPPTAEPSAPDKEIE